MSGNTRPSLEIKGNLIRHAYDSFLVAQTRLFVQATSNEESDSSDIGRRRELLLLDDLTSFAIAARRLIELTGLKSFANRCKVPLAYLDQSEGSYSVKKAEANIGFLTLMNRLIHASFIRHLSTTLDVVFFFAELSLSKKSEKDVLEMILPVAAKGQRHEAIEQLLVVSSDEGSVIISLRDMIHECEAVANKIIDACRDQKIFLEIWDI
jgi:hypothetical protein